MSDASGRHSCTAGDGFSLLDLPFLRLVQHPDQPLPEMQSALLGEIGRNTARRQRFAGRAELEGSEMMLATDRLPASTAFGIMLGVALFGWALFAALLWWL
jgi:hypothetical protein